MRLKDEGNPVDLGAGMEKLFASETCAEVTMEAMRIHVGYGYVKEYPVERYYREAPLMIIGEGTNETQKLIIARRLLKNIPYSSMMTLDFQIIATMECNLSHRHSDSRAPQQTQLRYTERHTVPNQ